MHLRTAAARSAGLAIALVLVSGTVASVSAEGNGEITSTMEFVFAPFIEYRGSPEGAQVLYEGTATASQVPQVFTVVFDYSRGGTAPALPDTAMAATE